MIGEGIKQIPAYKCTMSDTELNKLREDFWGKFHVNVSYINYHQFYIY
jgi:hypothetical protein